MAFTRRRFIGGATAAAAGLTILRDGASARGFAANERVSLAHVAGYVLADDLSERAFQLELSGGQWSKGKSSPGFGPLGPWLVSTDQVDPGNLRLRSWVNGEPRQDSRTSDMIFDVEYLVWHLSQFMILEPGDVVLTGTPEGVALSGRYPYLSPGDVVELEIDGLGRQRHEMVEAVVEGVGP